MYTRKQYLNKECTHREYYAQLVQPFMLDVFGPAMKELILNSEDEYLNDVSLGFWDILPKYGHVASKLRKAEDFPTQNDYPIPQQRQEVHSCPP